VDTTLVGVGGALRAMARYDQELAGYELDKIHNYRMDYRAAASIAKDLRGMDPEELAGVKAVGSNRADTIVAGSTVISILMQKMGFDRVVVSARGLREGILSVFARDARTFYSGGINNEKAKVYVAFACQQEVLPQYTFTFVRPLVTAGLMREKEKSILTHAIKEMADLPRANNINNLFYMIMDEDNAFLTHREQLILALSIVHSKKEKAAEWHFSRYRSILELQNMKSIKKISACLALSAILERSRAVAKLSIDDRRVAIRLVPGRQFLPAMLLAKALKNFEEAFNVSVACQVTANGSGRQEDVKVIV
jgi:exopolyphosphatase/guanosine-5'-triphosphate,3'-diphosphate pyrophosphatase